MDENIKKAVQLFLKRWKLIVLIGLIGAMLAYAYTANFTTLTYTSSVEFYAYVPDEDRTANTEDGSSIVIPISNTSKMDYAIRMITTYLALLDTNNFCTRAADSLNERLGSDYSAGFVRGAMATEATEDTALFTVSVTTTSSQLSYEMAQDLSEVIPDFIEESNERQVLLRVIDEPVVAGAAESLNYPFKCAIGFAAGVVLACAYVFLRDLLDVRVKSNEDLAARYNIPVLGMIPDFENASAKKNKKNKKTARRSAAGSGKEEE